MKKYDEGFKRGAARKIFEKQTVASVARELGVSKNRLHLWKKTRFEAGSGSGKGSIALKERLREVGMGNEILKRAALIFGRGPLGGTCSSRRKAASSRCVFCAG